MSARIPLPPYPTGWFCIAFERELGRRPRSVAWLGRRLQAHRSADGVQVSAADGLPIPPIRVQQGTVLGWFDLDGGPPTFELPCPDPAGFSPYGTHRWESLRTHPQETSENSVDVAHFSLVHGYSDVEVETPAQVDGPLLRARYSFTRRAGLLGLDLTSFRAEIDVLVAGLGYSYVENHVPVLGLRVRQLVLSTPIDEDRLTLRIAGAVQSGPLGPVADRLIRDVMMTGFAADVTHDLGIWQTKRYLERPRIVAGDGPIGRYRVWCRQFYPEAA